jgi:hypothetical protein
MSAYGTSQYDGLTVHVVAIQHSMNKENRVASSSFSAVD